MPKQKQIVVGVIVIILLITGGVFGYLYKTKMASVKNVQEEQNATTSPDVSKKDVSENKTTPTDFIELNGVRVGLVVPEKWGHLVVPKVKENAQIASDFKQIFTLPASFNTKKDASYFSYITYDFVGPVFVKIISDYKFPLETEVSSWDTPELTEVPRITLIKIPQDIQDDKNVEEGPGRRAYTADEKKRDINELFNTWNQRKITFQNIVDKDWNEYETVPSKYVEADVKKQEIYWWGTPIVNANEDRVAPKYWESLNGEFRGVGFFTTLGQDYPWGFYSYRVVLVNPEKRIAFQIDLPLSRGANDTLINSQHPEPSSDQERAKIIDEAYKYVENEENYKGTDLEIFMKDIQGIVGSLQIVSSNSTEGQLGELSPVEKSLLGTWVPVEPAGESLEDTFSIENGKHVYKTVIGSRTHMGTWEMNQEIPGMLSVHYQDRTGYQDPVTISLMVTYDAKNNQLIYNDEGTESKWKKIK